MTTWRKRKPGTIEHFAGWWGELILDNGEQAALEDFQALFIEDVFRGTPENWLVIPEGNAKTTLAGGFGLYHCEFTPQAFAPAAASSREQAEILYRQAEGLVYRSGLAGFRCLEGYRRIRFDPMGSRLQVMAADDRTGDGVIPTCCLIDELHRHRDLRLYRTWRGKLAKRGGFIITISTAGEPGSEFENTRERIRQTPGATRVGAFTHVRTEQIALHEYAVAEDGNVDDLDVVKAANPLKAVTVEELAQRKASPTMTPTHWRRFVCNLPTRSEAAAITEAEWFGAEVAEEIPEGQPVSAGLDVAWKWDTTALVPLFVKSVDYRLLGPATVLVPPRDGTSLDPAAVEAALVALHDRNPIHTLVMDVTRAEQLAVWAEQTIGCKVVERPQTNAYAVTDFERFMEALREGWLKHVPDAALTRHCLNAIARPLPGGQARFDRPHQSRFGSEQDMRVIDALSAAAMVNTFEAEQIGREPVEPMIAFG